MKNVEELKTILETEADLAHALLAEVTHEQEAIIKLQGQDVAATVGAQQELLKPLENLEVERTRCIQSIGGELKNPALGKSPTVKELVKALPATDGEQIAAAAEQLRSVVERIVTTNGRNKVLLDRSRRFVDETLRIVTEDHTRKIIDQRM
ncbi:MAG TPA: flagellar export chaperone FlgN [Bacteroidota bacterium]|nr:flagellar export chaperone FlgN [Bacteroidota bacterium]